MREVCLSAGVFSQKHLRYLFQSPETVIHQLYLEATKESVGGGSGSVASSSDLPLASYKRAPGQKLYSALFWRCAICNCVTVCMVSNADADDDGPKGKKKKLTSTLVDVAAGKRKRGRPPGARAKNAGKGAGGKHPAVIRGGYVHFMQKNAISVSQLAGRAHCYFLSKESDP